MHTRDRRYTWMAKLKRAAKHALLLTQLENVVAQKQRDVAALAEMHRRLCSRAYAIHSVLRNVEALYALSMALQQDHEGGGSADLSLSDAQDDLARLLEQMRREAIADAECALNPESGPASAAEEPFRSLGWCPVRAAEMAASAASELTTEGLRKRLRNLAAVGGCLLPRLYHDAPDGDTTIPRLEEARSEILQFLALLTICPAPGHPSPIMSVCLASLEEDAPPPTATAPALVTQSHWAYAYEQLALEPEQKERLLALLELSRARSQRFSSIREDLLRSAAERAHDLHAQQELVRELDRVQRSYTISVTASLLALYGTLLSAQQVAAYSVGSWPYAPSQTALVDLLLGDGRASESSEVTRVTP